MLACSMSGIARISAAYPGCVAMVRRTGGCRSGVGREAGTSADGAATQGVGNVGFAAHAAATDGAGPCVQQWRAGSMKQLGVTTGREKQSGRQAALFVEAMSRKPAVRMDLLALLPDQKE